MSRRRTPNAPRPLHPQVRVTVGEWAADVDTKLAPLIEALWRAGVETYMSCQAHAGTGFVWLAFASPDDAAIFLELVSEHVTTDLWQRAGSWYFGEFLALPGTAGTDIGLDLAARDRAWRWYVSVQTDEGDTPDARSSAITVSALFPPDDLPAVTAAVEAAADAVEAIDDGTDDE